MTLMTKKYGFLISYCRKYTFFVTTMGNPFGFYPKLNIF
jgi:hypothetical protein